MKKAKIIKIGNSRAVRIPREFLAQVNFEQDVLLESTGDSIVIYAASKRRAGWATRFKLMAQNGDDQLLDSSAKASAFDQEDWEWIKY